MVKNATSYTGNGLRDWLIQRVSAAILGVYIVFLMIFIVAHPQMDYGTWTTLFSSLGFKAFTILALLSLFAHAWIGVWTILTDYIKATCIRLPLTLLVILVLLAYLIWGIEIIWSI